MSECVNAQMHNLASGQGINPAAVESALGADMKHCAEKSETVPKGAKMGGEQVIEGVRGMREELGEDKGEETGLEGLKETKRGRTKKQQSEKKRGAGRGVSVLRLASCKTGNNPIIAWKYFFHSDYYLVQERIRPVKTSETHTCNDKSPRRKVTAHVMSPGVSLFASSMSAH